MTACGDAVSQTLEAMKAIAAKIETIDEIARSTNMLALNASIESARAGEYGKGFAVVASGVGTLADRSQTEASEIGKLSVASDHGGGTFRSGRTAERYDILLPSGEY